LWATTAVQDALWRRAQQWFRQPKRTHLLQITERQLFKGINRVENSDATPIAAARRGPSMTETRTDFTEEVHALRATARRRAGGDAERSDPKHSSKEVTISEGLRHARTSTEMLHKAKLRAVGPYKCRASAIAAQVPPVTTYWNLSDFQF